MGFERGKRFGKTWDDVGFIDGKIKNFKWKLTHSDERGFETAFASVLSDNSDKLNGDVISQVDKDAHVQSVYCFGKNHRPDITIDEDGIAIEIKFLDSSFDGVKMAFGQSIMYRLKYKFVITIFIISETNKSVYFDAADGKEDEMVSIMKYMAEELNVFTYIVPAFDTKNKKSVLEFNGLS